MARFIGKTKEDQEIFAYDMNDVQVKSVGENEIEMIGSTEHLDRDGEILKIDGWDLKNYKKNPVVLPSHMYWEPAIGRAKVRVEDKNLIFKIEFPPVGINPVADIYKGLYKGGFMKASSVGFIGQEWKWGEKEGDPRRTFLKHELLEISLVSVPSNPNAILTEKGIEQAVKAGKLRGDDVKVLEGLIKRSFELDPDRRKIFVVPNLEVKGDEQDKCEKCGIQCEVKADGKKSCGCKKENAAPEKPQGDLDPKADEKFLTADQVRSIVQEEIKNAVASKGHYINELLDEQGTDVPTDSTKQVEEVANALTGSFRLKA